MKSFIDRTTRVLICAGWNIRGTFVNARRRIYFPTAARRCQFRAMPDSHPLAANDTLADSIRRRAFRSGNPRTARKLLALAAEAWAIRPLDCDRR